MVAEARRDEPEAEGPGGGEDAAAPASDAHHVVVLVAREHGPYLGRCLRYLGVAEDELDDALQEVLIVVYRHAARLERHEELRAWLYRVAWHVARATRRKARLRRARFVLRGNPCERSESSGTEGHVSQAAGDPERAALAAELRETLDRLPARLRDAFVLHHVEGLSIREVAWVLGCGRQTAHDRVRRATERLRASFEEGAGEVGS